MSASPLQAVAAGLERASSAIGPTKRELGSRLKAAIAAQRRTPRRAALKSVGLAAAMTTALVDRGVPDPTAQLAAELGVLAFKRGHAQWLEGNREPEHALAYYTLAALDELREATASLADFGHDGRRPAVTCIHVAVTCIHVAADLCGRARREPVCAEGGTIGQRRSPYGAAPNGAPDIRALQGRLAGQREPCAGSRAGALATPCGALRAAGVMDRHSPQVRPSVLPTGGHVFSPLVAVVLPTTRWVSDRAAKPSRRARRSVAVLAVNGTPMVS